METNEQTESSENVLEHYTESNSLTPDEGEALCKHDIEQSLDTSGGRSTGRASDYDGAALCNLARDRACGRQPSSNTSNQELVAQERGRRKDVLDELVRVHCMHVNTSTTRLT